MQLSSYTVCAGILSIEMRTLFLGMAGVFSHIVLKRLLAARVPVAAVLIAGDQFRILPPPTPPASSALHLLNPHLSETVVHLAWQAGIPAYECGGLQGPELSSWLTDLSPDVACVACWNRLIPTEILDIPPHGFLNVHPSLLPAYRGPQPLFWQFRMGETATGVTVHWMNQGLDRGDIAAQRAVPFVDGMRAAHAEVLCASSGADLLAATLTALAQGKAGRQAQPAGGSYFPAPTADDFSLDATWPVRRAFNFIRGTAEWGIPYRLEVDGTLHWLVDALAWRPGGQPTEPTTGVWLRFRDGLLWARAKAELP